MCSVCAATAGGGRDYPSELVGRGNYVEDMVRDIRNLKAALGLLERNQREEKETGRYIDQLNKKIFDGQPCGNNCIYNPGQFL